MNRIGTIVTDMDQVMCVDESAKDNQTPARKQGVVSCQNTLCPERDALFMAADTPSSQFSPLMV